MKSKHIYNENVRTPHRCSLCLESAIFSFNKQFGIGLVSSFITAAIGYAVRLVVLNYLEYDILNNLANWQVCLSYFCSLGGIRFVINEWLKNTFLMSSMNGPSASTYSANSSTTVTSLAMNNPGGKGTSVTADNPGGGKRAPVTVDNPAEKGLSADTETIPADLRKALKDLKHASDKYNSIEKKNYNRMVTSFTDLHRDYLDYLSKEEKKHVLDTLHDKVDTSGELIDIHHYWKSKRRVNDAYWDKSNKMIQTFERNSKSIQQQLGGKKDLKSEYFRKELNIVKTAYSENYKEKEAIIKKQLAKSKNVDKLLKENNMTVHHLWNKIIK